MMGKKKPTGDELNERLNQLRHFFLNSGTNAGQNLFLMECIKEDIMENCYGRKGGKVRA